MKSKRKTIRVKCPYCFKHVAVKQDGTFFKHFYFWSDKKCKGSLKLAVKKEEE